MRGPWHKVIPREQISQSFLVLSPMKPESQKVKRMSAGFMAGAKKITIYQDTTLMPILT